MDKSIVISEGKEKKKYTLKNNLVLSIDQNERIIKFNKECEYLSGFTKTEVLNKPIFGLLIPRRYENLWINVLKFSRQHKIVDDIKLPLLTKYGHEIMISWSSFPVKNEEGKINEINLVGYLIKEWIDVNELMIDRKTDFEISDIQLKKINAELMKKNEILEKTLTKSKTRKEFEDKLNVNYTDFINKGLYSFSELFGGKKRKQEINNIIHELDEREKFLNNKESELVKDKRQINEKIIEFKKWRKRLELLEGDIENRRKSLKNQETMLISNIKGNGEEQKNEITEKDLKESYDNFEKISNTAVIIHRGIIKKANDNFTDLIGYKNSEIINKSFFDFISSEGFYEIERYYLNRLKGEDVSFYNTIFLTKNNNKIPVEINTKPTFFNGEKAEIMIIKKLKNEEK
jgi:PAS domain S-box-containing protein